MFYWFVYNPSLKRRLKANRAEFRQCAAWQQQLDKNTLILESFKYLEVEFVTFEVNSFSLESSTGLGTCLQGFWVCCTAPSLCLRKDSQSPQHCRVRPGGLWIHLPTVQGLCPAPSSHPTRLPGDTGAWAGLVSLCVRSFANYGCSQ